MPQATHALPPYTEPHIVLSQTPSPVRDTSEPSDALVSGVELIISKLPCNGITTATQHLRAILGEYAEQHPSEYLVSVSIVPGDEQNPVDYVFVSIDPSITQEPRPDLLEKIWIILTSRYNLQAD